MKKFRIISPFISLFLIALLLAGSFGFTIIHHTCLHCGTDETVAAITVSNETDRCCCYEETGVSHCHSTGEMVFSDDCCSHDSERIVTDELVRTEVQNEIIPYFLAATIVAVIGEQPVKSIRTFTSEQSFTFGRDINTMLCKIQS